MAPLSSSIASAALYSGLAYLQCIVVYSLVTYDIPAASLHNNKAAQQKAFDHYCNRRKSDVSYKVVPVACCLLTGGVFSKIVLERGSLGSIVTLVVTFLTVYNNGKNVVNPAIALAADAKGDKQDLSTVLSGIRRGHWIDFIGLTGIFFLVTFL